METTTPAPYFLPPPEGPQKSITRLGSDAPWRWLALGWRDLRAHPGIALFYGVCFWLMAVVLALVFRSTASAGTSATKTSAFVGSASNLRINPASPCVQRSSG